MAKITTINPHIYEGVKTSRQNVNRQKSITIFTPTPLNITLSLPDLHRNKNV